MKLSLIRKNQRNFESKINKRAKFFRSLPKKKFEGIKRVEEGKTELIIDKILGIGEFERNYAFFCNNKINENSYNDNIKKVVKPSLMNRISDLVQKESMNKYEKLDTNQSEKKYNYIREESEKKYDNAGKYWRMNKQTKLEKENYESFLSKMGYKVVLNELFSKDKNPLNNSENNNPRKNYRKYNLTEN